MARIKYPGNRAEGERTVRGGPKELAGTAAWFIAVGPHVWGRGRTPAEAHKGARAQGGSLKRSDTCLMLVVGNDDEAGLPYVNDMGGLCTYGAATIRVEVGY